MCLFVVLVYDEEAKSNTKPIISYCLKPYDQIWFALGKCDLLQLMVFSSASQNSLYMKIYMRNLWRFVSVDQ